MFDVPRFYSSLLCQRRTTSRDHLTKHANYTSNLSLTEKDKKDLNLFSNLIQIKKTLTKQPISYKSSRVRYKQAVREACETWHSDLLEMKSILYLCCVAL